MNAQLLAVTEVILVNEFDEPLGSLEKMAAHRQALLHRAFSVFIFNSRGEMLLQQRALSKYHSGGLWTNACCSHPMPGEETLDAANRRLFEELGMKTSLKKIFDFTYKAGFDNGLTEYEFDHVFIGTFDGDINADSEEVQDYRFMPMEALMTAIQEEEESFTAWFRIALPRVDRWLKEHKS